MTQAQIDVATLDHWRKDGHDPVVLDVREPWEVEICALPGSLFIPMGSVPDRLSEIPTDRPVVVLCHHGVRSAHVTAWLHRHGIDKAVNLAGGIDAWARQIDSDMEVY